MNEEREKKRKRDEDEKYDEEMNGEKEEKEID